MSHCKRMAQKCLWRRASDCSPNWLLLGTPLEDSHSFTLHLCTLFRAVVLQSSFALYRRAWFKNQIPGAILHA